MKITDAFVHIVNVPLETAYRWAPGLYFGTTKGIIELYTDEGVIGLGEVTSVEQAIVARDMIFPRLIGADPMNLEECFARCVPQLETIHNLQDTLLLRAFGGVEIALWDIKGKALGVPVYVLLGGQTRSEVAFSEYFALRMPSAGVAGESTPLEVARFCAAMREEHGSTVFEGKVGVTDLSTEVEMVREIRAAVGQEATLRLDANMAWPVNVARTALRQLEPYDIANIEDPVGPFREMAKLRQHSAIPFSSHIPDVQLAVEQGVPDTLVINLTSLGGIRETLKLIAACELFGIGFWFYSGDTGVATAAYMQVTAALPYLTQPHQSLLRWYTDDVIEGGPMQPENGVIKVPDGPGLGVELDPAALARCKERFENDGVMHQIGDVDRDNFARLALQ